MLSVLFAACVALMGCGSSGYAGGSLTSLSNSAVTIDAGQSFPFGATLSGNPIVSWSVTGGSCSSTACGSLSNSTGSTVTYTAPANVASQMKVQLVASVDGTSTKVTAEITVNPDPVISGTTPSGTVGASYSGTLSATGGTAPLKWSTTGSLPAGLTFNGGKVSGVPTAAGSSSFTAQIVDSSDVPFTVSSAESIAIASASVGGSLTISGQPAAGTVGVTYSSALSAAGGTAPYTWSVLSGSLPAGLTLSTATGTISGTPSAAGTSVFTVQAVDANGNKGSAPFSIVINSSSSALHLTMATLPGATVGTPYSATVGVSGGTAPYSCMETGGSLPAGLSLDANCVVSGTPTTAGVSVVTVKASDASSPVETTSGPESITVSPASTLALTSPPSATVGVPYTGSIGVTGGSAPYNCVIVSGSLPAGLTMGSACSITGTPTTAGMASLTVKATDSSNPAKSITGPVTLSVTTSTLSLTLSTLPGATVGVPYSATIGVSGGTSPYTCNIVSGALPAGLTESSCLISGTPTAAGTVQLMVKATDASSPAQSVTGPESLTVAPASLALALTNLPNATVGTPYTATIGVTGGTAPYNCTLLSGALPAGLSISGCVVSGTPTVAGAVMLQVKATDSSPSVETANGPVGLTVLPAATLTLTSPPNATVGVPYSGPIGVSGGTAPYTCSLVTGTLPAGLTLNGCTITGTPTTPGSTTITVKGTDSSNPTDNSTGPVTITVLPAITGLTLTSPPNATVDTPYTGIIGVSGGTAPYNCSITTGTLPAGLNLGAACTITGTPTTAGTSTVTVSATDSANPVATKTGPVSITVQPVPTLTLTGSLPNATLGQPYTQTLTATGGITPYTYTVSAGALPAGLTLASSTGVISGTPTAAGASSFTVTVTDTETTPQTASLPLVLLVVYPTTPNDAEFVGPYAYLFQGYDDTLLGLFADQTATVGSFTADGKGGVTAGEMDLNHQASNPTGNTISSNAFLGTYTIGADNTGSLTLTPLNADGTTGTTATYAMTVKAPITPATVATQASMIEYDNDQLAGTKGSGSILAQQASAVTAGLNGSYAFGLSGDAPCIPTCTAGIVAAPAAAVGQFTTNSTGQLISGATDANIGSTNYPNVALSGTYGISDGNGRVALTMDPAGTATGEYPTDFAVYVVNANQAFILSTDKHSDYVLLAGTAQLQTQASFSNASMNGAFIGYENAQSNPGLLGTVLQSTLNLSTATIFRAVGDGAGNCNTTNVDAGGLTALVTGLTGLGSGNGLLNDLLGTYQTTGNSVCTVAANGRGVLNYPTPNTILTELLSVLGITAEPPAPREFYLVSPASGYFLETGFAGLGQFQAQTGAPFSLATLNGTYVYADQPASSVASIDSSGSFVANGKGSATTTLDLNIGVGTLNILSGDVTTTAAYSLTDATAGRFVFNTNTVVYAITPTTFVLVDTNPLTTSPSISLLY